MSKPRMVQKPGASCSSPGPGQRPSLALLKPQREQLSGPPLGMATSQMGARLACGRGEVNASPHRPPPRSPARNTSSTVARCPPPNTVPRSHRLGRIQRLIRRNFNIGFDACSFAIRLRDGIPCPPQWHTDQTEGHVLSGLFDVEGSKLGSIPIVEGPPNWD